MLQTSASLFERSICHASTPTVELGYALDLTLRLSHLYSYASLYQHPPGSFRGPKEAVMFKQALEVMMDLCMHWR